MPEGRRLCTAVFSMMIFKPYSPRVFVGQLVPSVFVALAIIVMRSLVSRGLAWAPLVSAVQPFMWAVVGVLAFFGVLRAAFVVWFSVYTVGSAVTVTRGPWVMHQQTMPLSRVADVMLRRTLLDVVFGTGSLLVQGPASDENLLLECVRAPQVLRETLLSHSVLGV